MSYNECDTEESITTDEAGRSVADTLISVAHDAIAALGDECEGLKDRLSYLDAEMDSAYAELVALRRRRTQYRTGSHNPRNIYRAGVDRDTDEHIGVRFTPEMARHVVYALNANISLRPSTVAEESIR